MTNKQTDRQKNRMTRTHIECKTDQKKNRMTNKQTDRQKEGNLS